MRLIDADVLKDNILIQDNMVLTAMLKQWIDNQPTIDAVPVEYGQWKKVWGEWKDGYGWKYSCSKCGTVNKQYAPPYCPHCGVRMKPNRSHAASEMEKQL